MKTYTLTENDILDLWRLAKAGEHPPSNMVTPKLKEIGFKSTFVDNNFGGYTRVYPPRWFNRKALVHDFLILLSKIKLYNFMTKEEVNFINNRYARIQNYI